MVRAMIRVGRQREAEDQTAAIQMRLTAEPIVLMPIFDLCHSTRLRPREQLDRFRSIIAIDNGFAKAVPARMVQIDSGAPRFP